VNEFSLIDKFKSSKTISPSKLFEICSKSIRDVDILPPIFKN